jgi:ClpP class serine protease
MYAKPSSFVGSVGVILSPAPPLIPGPPREQNVLTGPFKAQGGDRKHFVALTDQLKRSFAQLVEIERGAKLTITIDQVTQAGIYSGIEGVRLGLVDGIGGREDAIQKAASLASITGYDLVDVNTEVARIMNEKLDRIWEPLDSKPLFATAYVDRPGLADTLTGEEALGDATGLGILPWGGEAEVLRTLPFPGGLGEDPATALPDFPLKINGPNVYYLYVGPTP